MIAAEHEVRSVKTEGASAVDFIRDVRQKPGDVYFHICATTVTYAKLATLLGIPQA